MEWADEFRTLKVRTNADVPRDAKQAVEFGAEGIGLCRTEHMFFEEERLPIVQAMILSETDEERKAHLDKLLPFQRADFEGLFEAMDGLPVIIRLIDPPLHEFLPHTEKQQKDLAEKIGVTLDYVKLRVQQLHEFNPMLGHRGCRLGVTYPEIYLMQAEAIVRAACELKKQGKMRYFGFSCHHDNVAELLHLPGGIEPLALIAVGHPTEKKEPAERFDPGKTHHNRW